MMQLKYRNILFPIAVSLLAFNPLQANAVQDISIHRIHGRTILRISGTGSLLWKDIYLKGPPRLVLKIDDCINKARSKDFLIERGGIRRISFEQQDRDLNVTIELDSSYSYSAYNDTECDITISIATPKDCESISIEHAEIDIFGNSTKYMLDQNVNFKWQCSGASDSTKHRYRFVGPKNWDENEYMEWSDWHNGRYGKFEHNAFKSKGTYILIVQYLFDDSTKVEKKYKFKVK
jgi:hypothetical protein